MSARGSRGLVWLASLGLLVVACGAEKSGAAPAESPSKASDSVQKGPPYPQSNEARPAYAQPPPNASGASPGRQQPSSAEDVLTERQRAEVAWQDLETARGQLLATIGDCALACKALASMDRATSHICSVAAGAAADDAHCGNARETLKTARRRVRAECTVCPNGVSVDPDAPIPSAPP